jgi:N-acetylglucosaminyldiphosphoundecaprenol N-acetyl-beta-D-mannosaminyltransferase
MSDKYHDFLLRDVVCILGLPFDRVTLSSAINKVMLAIEIRQCYFLSTPNLNFAIAAQSDSVFFQSVVDSDLSVADGMPLIWVAKLLGLPFTERVAGSTLFEELSKQQDRKDKIKVFFFGGQAGIAELAHQKLNETSSAMVSCGFYAPGFVSVEEMSSPEAIDQINATSPDFLVIALGAKKGQAWIQKNRHQLNTSVISHLGAVINFVAGSVERAPSLWQRSGLEWLWRIRQEPTLWKRYFFDGLAFLKLILFNVLPLALYDRWLKRSDDFNTATNISSIQTENGRIVIRLTGRVHHAVLEPVKQALSEIFLMKSDVSMDCSELTYIDSAFIGTLLLFQRYLNESGYRLILCRVPTRIKRILKLNNVITRLIFLDD